MWNLLTSSISITRKNQTRPRAAERVAVDQYQGLVYILWFQKVFTGHSPYWKSYIAIDQIVCILFDFRFLVYIILKLYVGLYIRMGASHTRVSTLQCVVGANDIRKVLSCLHVASGKAMDIVSHVRKKTEHNFPRFEER